MSNKPKGGRGHAAPYETKQMRIPVGLEPQIQELIARYREWISSSGSSIVGCDNPPRLLDLPVDSFSETSISSVKPVDNFNDAGVWNVYERVRGKDEEWKLVGSHKTEYAADSQIKTRKDHNHRKNSMNDYGVLSLEWEKRLELILQVLPVDSFKDTNAFDPKPVDKLKSRRSRKLKGDRMKLPVDALHPTRDN